MTLKVYYIDDEVDLCEIFQDYFASANVEVRTFSDPKKALLAAANDPPDALFVDYRLPGTNGGEVAKAMSADIPKYLITGDITTKTDFPFKAIISKPYKPEEIQILLDALLKLKPKP